MRVVDLAPYQAAVTIVHQEVCSQCCGREVIHAARAIRHVGQYYHMLSTCIQESGLIVADSLLSCQALFMLFRRWLFTIH
jgi:hypothetical protein